MVVPCYSYDVCNLVPFSLLLLLHYLVTDYTHSFSHPTFCKIVQLSSHLLLSVKLMISNPCIPLGGGGSLYKFEK
jgi:hypothetical protein